MKEQLKYLFSAKFADGLVMDQTPEDASILFRGKSEFTDVFLRSRQVPLVEFYLSEVDNTGKAIGNIVGVSLTNGYFLMNGLEFWADGEMPGKATYKDFTIIFYRKHNRMIDQITSQEIGHEVFYQLGWKGIKTNKDGIEEPDQRIIEFM